MRVDYIALSIPVFFALMAIEIIAARALRTGYYNFPDSIADLGCGIVQQVSSIFLRVAIVGGYEYLYANHRFTEISATSTVAWVVLFFGVDFFYYWFHRVSHEVNLLWAAHVVHHQSEEYNLAVALRQASFQGLFSWVFYLPLALVGFPPVMFGTMLAFNTLYQFWIHTRFVPKLGPLEWIFNTPSHHRVHHGRNPEYIDRNHGGTLIIWDRLFGTFEPEGAPVIYGVTEPLASFNPVWANFHYFRDLLDDSRRAKTLKDAVKLWFAPPGWKPPTDVGFRSRSIALDAPKYDRPLSADMIAYALVQFLPVIFGTVAVLDLRGKATLAELAVIAFFICFGCANLGGLFDGRRWALPLEAARLSMLAALVVAAVPYYGLSHDFAGIALGLVTGSLVWILARRTQWTAVAAS